MLDAAPSVSLTLNGVPARLGDGAQRLSHVLRERCGLTGVKVGCNAGDCGACTVLLDGEPVCACLVAAGQVEGRTVETIEGLDDADPLIAGLRRSFHIEGAAQCGVCTPAALLAAVALLRRNPNPAEAEVADALGGVLCRCTGYSSIVAAVMRAGAAAAGEGDAVGRRLPRLDGARKLSGAEIFGADDWPDDALLARAVRSPHAHAEFSLGDLGGYVAAHPGVVAVFTASDVPGANLFGVMAPYADQPALAEGFVRFRGEAVALVVGEAEAVQALALARFPVTYSPRPALTTIEAALAPEAPRLHPGRPGNILAQGPRRSRRSRGRARVGRRRSGRRVRDRLRRARLYRAGSGLRASHRRSH